MAEKGRPELPVTDARKAAFLEALRNSGGVFASACRATGVHLSGGSRNPPGYSTWRALMARDPEFAAAVEQVLQECREDVEAEIYRRAQVGTLEPIVQKGKQATLADGSPAFIRRYSDRLLLKRAAALMPDKYGDHKTVEHRGFVSVGAAGLVLTSEDFIALDETQRGQLREILTVIREHREGVKAIPHQPAEIVADYEEVSEADEWDSEEEPIAW